MQPLYLMSTVTASDHSGHLRSDDYHKTFMKARQSSAQVHLLYLQTVTRALIDEGTEYLPLFYLYFVTT